jgi:predicted nucleic acid-binding protein
LTSAVDTNVLLDVLTPDAPNRYASRDILNHWTARGALIISEPVYTELSAKIDDQAELDEFLDAAVVLLTPSTPQALHLAGRAWGNYILRRPAALECPKCGAPQRIQCQRCNANIEPRQHVAADFIIGAHALLQADRLLTRDEGYYATCFPELALG